MFDELIAPGIFLGFRDFIYGSCTFSAELEAVSLPELRLSSDPSLITVPPTLRLSVSALKCESSDDSFNFGCLFLLIAAEGNFDIARDGYYYSSTMIVFSPSSSCLAMITFIEPDVFANTSISGCAPTDSTSVP